MLNSSFCPDTRVGLSGVHCTRLLEAKTLTVPTNLQSTVFDLQTKETSVLRSLTFLIREVSLCTQNTAQGSTWQVSKPYFMESSSSFTI